MSQPDAPVDPVAQVLVDVPLAHLDRPFDYAVPAALAEAARPGARVKVRFAGRDVDGFVLARSAGTEHEGRLAPLRRVVSPEPVLTSEIAELTARVAARYAGTRSDVLRLAVPPRHARVEAEPWAPVAEPAVDRPAAVAAWVGHEHAEAFVAHLGSGGSPRAVWTAAPTADWARLLAHVVAVTRASGRGAVVCVPDVRDVARLAGALDDVLGPDQYATLTADLGPAKRYREFLSVLRGARRVAIGTRSAAFAPVRDLGLVAVWDDGDDLHAEPRAPYPHTRETLLLRASQQGAGALVGGYGRSVEAAYLVRTGWAHEIAATRELVRERVSVLVAGATDAELERDPYARGARLPTAAYHAVRDGLEDGPVLVQTPRSGYAPSVACERCRAPARCASCTGPLGLSGPTSPPACRWCGAVAEAWACAACGHRGCAPPCWATRAPPGAGAAPSRRCRSCARPATR
ncbi:MAG: hypothetical protein R2734_00635 [Nocardioides sp.]